MSDGLKKFGLSLLIVIGMFIPVYIFLAANAYFDPVTFFEKVVMFGLGYVLLFSVQIWMFIIGVGVLIATWSD